jgi:type IV pilus assembly protein PilV
MIKSTSDAKFRSEASYIAQQRVGQMWSDPANVATYIEAATDISALIPAGTRTVAQPLPGGPYVVTVTWQQPGEAVHNFTTIASIAGG